MAYFSGKKDNEAFHKIKVERGEDERSISVPLTAQNKQNKSSLR